MKIYVFKETLEESPIIEFRFCYYSEKISPKRGSYQTIKGLIKTIKENTKIYGTWGKIITVGIKFSCPWDMEWIEGTKESILINLSDEEQIEFFKKFKEHKLK